MLPLSTNQNAPTLQDLPRTFPKSRVMSSEEGQAALGRVLLAFSVHKPSIGYCQSMNYIAALLLMVMQDDEEHAFWLLVSLIDDGGNPPPLTSPSPPDDSADIEEQAFWLLVSLSDDGGTPPPPPGGFCLLTMRRYFGGGNALGLGGISHSSGLGGRSHSFGMGPPPHVLLVDPRAPGWIFLVIDIVCQTFPHASLSNGVPFYFEQLGCMRSQPSVELMERMQTDCFEV